MEPTASSAPAAAIGSTPAAFAIENQSAQCDVERPQHTGDGGGAFKVEKPNFKYLLEIQSILMKLKEEPVRRAFVARQIIKVDNPQAILQSFDGARELFCPRFIPMQLDRRLKHEELLDHFKLINSESEELFILPGEASNLKPFTYKMWKHALNKLMCSSYWLKAQCVNSGTSDSEMESNKSNGKLKKAKFYNDAMNTSSDEDFVGTYVRKRKRTTMRTTKARKPIETIVLSDSSTDSSAGESPDSSFRTHRSKKSWGRYTKEVVQPEKFDLNGKQSLKQFLEAYERYFRNRYDGSERECTQELGKFISGELRDAYDALGGAQRKYREIKDELLSMVPNSENWKDSSMAGRV